MPSWGPDLVDKLISISISIYKANVVYLDCKIDNTIKKDRMSYITMTLM